MDEDAPSSRRPGLRALRLLSALLFALAPLHPAASAEVIRFGGSGTGVAALAKIAEEYARTHPGVSLEPIVGLGSGGGIAAVAEGVLELAASARPLTPSERERGLSEIPCARTPFVVAVSERGRVRSVSASDLARIYSGERTAWPDGTPIRLVLRPEKDSDTALLRGFGPELAPALGRAHAREGLFVAGSDQEAAEAIEASPGGIGTTTLGQIVSTGRRLYPLPIDGAVPAITGPEAARYPHWKPLILVLRARSSEAVRTFVSFLQGPEGRKALARTGHLPVRADGHKR